METFAWLAQPWPWYVAGPILGLFAPTLLLIGNKKFGISANLRHICAMIAPGRQELFDYDWRKTGTWNLLFFGGIALGGFSVGFGSRYPGG